MPRRPPAARSSPSSVTSVAPIQLQSAAFRGRRRCRSNSNCVRTRHRPSSSSGQMASLVRTTVQVSSPEHRTARARSNRSAKVKAAPRSQARRGRAKVSSNLASGRTPGTHAPDKARNPAPLRRGSRSAADSLRSSPERSRLSRRRRRRHRAPDCIPARRRRPSRNKAPHRASPASSNACPAHSAPPPRRADPHRLRRRRTRRSGRDPFPFSPCGRRWRDAPDEGLLPQTPTQRFKHGERPLTRLAAIAASHPLPQGKRMQHHGRIFSERLRLAA